MVPLPFFPQALGIGPLDSHRLVVLTQRWVTIVHLAGNVEKGASWRGGRRFPIKVWEKTETREADGC